METGREKEREGERDSEGEISMAMQMRQREKELRLLLYLPSPPPLLSRRLSLISPSPPLRGGGMGDNTTRARTVRDGDGHARRRPWPALRGPPEPEQPTDGTDTDGAEPEVNPESGRALVQRSPALRLRFGVEERNAERTA